MKKLFITLGIPCFLATPMMVQAGDVKVSGAIEIQYNNSSDNYASQGDDKIQPEEIYVQISSEVADNVEALIKLDGADLNNKTGSSSTHKVVEEAQVIFKNVANAPMTLTFGKDEMPWGQDYEKFMFSSVIHGFEVDKVWGVHGDYKIDSFGSIAAAFFERAPKESGGSSTDKDTSLTDSFAAKIKADKLVDNLSVEASFAKTGKDDAVAAEVDEDRFSVGAVFSVANLTLHVENISFSDFGNTQNSDLNVLQIGADYKIGNWLAKARHEASDDDVDNNNSEEGRTAVGVSYYFSDKASVAVEWEQVAFDGTMADEDAFLMGAAFKF